MYLNYTNLQLTYTQKIIIKVIYIFQNIQNNYTVIYIKNLPSVKITIWLMI